MATASRESLPVAMLALLAGHAAAQPCQPSWPVRFVPAGATLFNGGDVTFSASVVFDDDGPGPHSPALYVSGNFDHIGGVAAPGFARWTGTAWETVGSGFSGPGDMVVFDDDGAGPHLPALYAIGKVGSVGAIARWDGQQWSVVASGPPLFENTYPIFAAPNRLFVLPGGGTGPLRLHAGRPWESGSPGGFSSSGSLFRLDPSGWAELGTDGRVSEAVVFDPDGPGPATPGIYVACTFLSWSISQGSIYHSRVSRLTATGFSDILSVTSTIDPATYDALAVFDDDGAGPVAASLYVAGTYPLTPGGASEPHISRWTGTGLATIEGDIDNTVARLQVLSDDPANPGHPGMYAMGVFGMIGGVSANGLARWNGTAWSGFGPGFVAAFPYRLGPSAVAAFDDDGSGPRPTFLYAVGDFTAAGFDPARGIARWDGHYWEPPGKFVNNAVHAMVAADVGAGPSLYVGGQFTSADGLPAVGVARWDGQAFSRMTGGMNNHVDALAVFGGSLYAAGKFTWAGGATARHIARWTGSEWAAVGGGLYGNVDTLAVYDGGSGPDLYAGGSFSLVYGWIARWDGQQWSAVGTGINGEVSLLRVHGGLLYAAGLFDTAGTEPAQGLARWDGSAWHAVGDPPVYPVTAMASHGGALYVAGTRTDGLCVHALYGTSWHTLPPVTTGVGTTNIASLSAFDEDGAGPSPAVLYASVEFTDAGSVPATRLMRWDGRAWSVVAAGIDAPVRTFAPFGPGLLYMGGDFRTVGGQTSWYMAGLSACPSPCYANCDGSTSPPVLNVLDFTCFLNLFGAGEPAANCDMSTGAPALNVLDFTCFLNRFAAGCP